MSSHSYQHLISKHFHLVEQEKRSRQRIERIQFSSSLRSNNPFSTKKGYFVKQASDNRTFSFLFPFPFNKRIRLSFLQNEKLLRIYFPRSGSQQLVPIVLLTGKFMLIHSTLAVTAISPSRMGHRSYFSPSKRMQQ